MKQTKRINFYEGKVCIKNPDNTLDFQDDSCIPLLKEKIDEYIEKHPATFSAKIIIFDVLKEYFKVNNLFITPYHNNFVPTSDSLYNEFLHYVSNNPTYAARLNKQTDITCTRRQHYIQNVRDSFQIDQYEKERRLYFSKKKRNSSTR